MSTSRRLSASIDSAYCCFEEANRCVLEPEQRVQRVEALLVQREIRLRASRAERDVADLRLERADPRGVARDLVPQRLLLLLCAVSFPCSDGDLGVDLVLLR